YRGVNYRVQGTEAALVKDRMIAVYEEVLPDTPYKLLGQIHDEIGFAVREEEDDPAHLLRIVQCLEDHTGHMPFMGEFPCSIDRVDRYWNERVKVSKEDLTPKRKGKRK